jgi:hypothetical protein
MQNDYTRPEFKKLLQKLQEESWQLELLISGFAIFGLFTAIPVITESLLEAENNQQEYTFVISLVATISCYILIFNLLLHVLLRGLWIGALGLRYVSGDIDYDSLKYSQKFTNYLKKNVGSFDKYIGTLENYCSIIFAISFLLIFYVLAITFTILSITLISNLLIENEDLPEWLSQGVGIALIVFIVFGMFFTLIDFLTLGFLKKKKWLSTIYFPVYRVFGFITLSFLYRPLVYNFLDNKFGKRLSFALVPFYIFIALATTLKYNVSNILRNDMTSSEYVANNNNYEDLLYDSDEFIDNVAIQSKVITDNYVKVFVLFSKNIEDKIFKFNPEIKPDEDNRGLKSAITFGNNVMLKREKRDSLRRAYLKTFNDMYSVKIDTVKCDSDFIIAKSGKGNLGFETYVSTKDLIDGKHILNVNRLRIKRGDTTNWNISKIPFWYYKN